MNRKMIEIVMRDLIWHPRQTSGGQAEHTEITWIRIPDRA